MPDAILTVPEAAKLLKVCDKTKKAERLTMSVEEAAAELGICSKNVYTLTHRADFPALRIGNRVRISREGLRAWVKANINNGGMKG